MRTRSICRVTFVLSFVWIAGCTQVTSEPQAQAKVDATNRAFQTSTIPALLDGVYDGDMSLKRLSGFGNFGLGTFNDVDGEMVLMDGTFYQVKADGTVDRPGMETKTPLAVVTYFRPVWRASLPQSLSYKELQLRLDELRVSNNVPCAIRIEGVFDLVTTRSVPRQSVPYRRLVDVTKEQPTFEFKQVRGTIVAFWFPQYMQGLNVPGYHLHFLTADRTAGGHVLECRPRQVTVQVAEMTDITVRMPPTDSFRKAALNVDRRDELRAVEQASTRPADR